MKKNVMRFAAFAACAALVVPFAITGCGKGGGADTLDGVVFELNEAKDAYIITDTTADFNKTDYTVPETFNGKPVTEIAEKAFSGCKSIEKLTVPASVKTIGAAAFKGLKSLQELVVPFVGTSAEATGEEGLLGYMFGNKAFSNSSKIYQTVDGEEYKEYVPNSLVSVRLTGDSAVKEGAFSACEYLETVVIEAASSIGTNAFLDCDGLSTVYIGTQTLAQAITSKEAAGGLCANAMTVGVEQGISNVGSFITSSLELQSGTQTVGEKTYKIYGAHLEGGAFYRKEGTGWQLIGLESGFNKTELKIPAQINGADVVSIKTAACANAKTLTSVVIPATVTTIGAGAFRGCNALTDIYLASQTIAQSVQSASDFGGLFYYAKSAYIATTVAEISAWLTSFYPSTDNPTEKDGVNYTRHYSEEMTLRMEAENAILVGTRNDKGIDDSKGYPDAAFVRTHSGASEQHYVGNFNGPGCVATFNFNSTKACRATLTIRVANIQGKDSLSTLFIAKLNGKDINGWNEASVEGVVMYYDWNELTFEIDLQEGANTLVLTAMGVTNNFDYVEITAMATLSWTPREYDKSRDPDKNFLREEVDG